MMPHFSFGRRSENSDVPWSRAIVNASSPRRNFEASWSVRIRRRRSTLSACCTLVGHSVGTGCGRFSFPFCRATRSPWSRRPPTSWGDVNDVVPADDREVHLALGLAVLRLLRGAEDEVHVGIESFEDSAVSPPAFQLNHHVRINRAVRPCSRRRRYHSAPTPTKPGCSAISFSALTASRSANSKQSKAATLRTHGLG